MGRPKGSMNCAMRELHERGLKRCNLCQEVKTHGEFASNGIYCLDGLRGRCLTCEAPLNAATKIRYREANRDRYYALVHEWHACHPERTREISRIAASRRRALKRDQFIEDVEPQIVYEMHGGMCGICEEFIPGDFEVDHVKPLSKGGMHGYINVQPAHMSCNRRKGAKMEDQRYE